MTDTHTHTPRPMKRSRSQLRLRGAASLVDKKTWKDEWGEKNTTGMGTGKDEPRLQFQR